MRFREPMTFPDWLGRWLDRRLWQPTLIQDPKTGAWRGATDEDYAAWMEEMNGEDR